MITIKEVPIVLSYPCKPFFKQKIGIGEEWWRLCGYAPNQIMGMNPFNPFDIIAAWYTFLRYRIPAQRKYNDAKALCRKVGHDLESRNYYTDKGIYQSRECKRCWEHGGYYRPDGTKVDKDWCEEGHVLNCVFTDGRCCTCGEQVLRAREVEATPHNITLWDRIT